MADGQLGVELESSGGYVQGRKEVGKIRQDGDGFALGVCMGDVRRDKIEIGNPDGLGGSGSGGQLRLWVMQGRYSNVVSERSGTWSIDGELQGLSYREYSLEAEHKSGLGVVLDDNHRIVEMELGMVGAVCRVGN